MPSGRFYKRTTSNYYFVPSGRFYKRRACNYLFIFIIAKWQVLQTNNLQTSFIFMIMPSGKFYKRTVCKLLLFSSLCQVASSTNEQLANIFYFHHYAKWRVLQTNSLQILFTSLVVLSGKFYKRTTCKPFSISCQVVSSTNEKLANTFTFILCQAAGSTNGQLANPFHHVPSGRFYK